MITDLKLIPESREYKLDEAIRVNLGFRVIGGLRESFIPDVWTVAWEDNDKMVRLKMEASLRKGGVRGGKLPRPGRRSGGPSSIGAETRTFRTGYGRRSSTRTGARPSCRIASRMRSPSSWTSSSSSRSRQRRSAGARTRWWARWTSPGGEGAISRREVSLGRRAPSS